MDEITAGLVVQAVAKGFEAVITQLDYLVKSEQKLTQETEKSNQAKQRAAETNRRLAEQRRAMASASALAAQRYQEEQATMKRLMDTTNKSANILLGLATAGGVAIASTTGLAARVETLGVVVDTLGGNLGFTNNEMRGFEDSLVSQGITLQKAREGLALMAQANLDLTESLNLAKLAQNAAVIAGVDSSEAYKRLVYVITSGNVRMARTLGLQVSFQDAFQKTAEETGRSTMELGANEKANIRMQEVLRAGISIQGAYDAAMETAGKKITSLNRHWEEARRLVGEEYVPAYGQLIDLVTAGLKSFNEMDAVQRRTLVTVSTSVVAWSAMTGGISKSIAMVSKLSTAIQAVGLSKWLGQFAVVGPVGIFAAAITAAAAAIHIYNMRIEEQNLKNKDFQSNLLENAQTYADYVAGLQQYGAQQGVMVVTAEEYQQALYGVDDAQAAVYGSMEEYDAAMQQAEMRLEATKTAVVLMSEETFNLATQWMRYTDSATAMEAATRLQGASLAYYAEHGQEAAIVTGLFDAKIRDSLFTMKEAQKETRNLETAMQAVASKAMEDYGKGQEDAVEKMIFDLVKLQITMGEYGESTDGVLAMVADAWGMADDVTEEAIGNIALWLQQAADSGDWETFINKIQNYSKELEYASIRQREMGETAEEATPKVGDLIEKSSTDVGSAISSFINDIRWFMAGGYKVVEYFEAVQKAIQTGKVDPSAAEALLEPALVAYESLAVSLDEKSPFEAATALVNNLTMTYDPLIKQQREAVLYTKYLNDAVKEGTDITDEFKEKLEARASHDAIMEQYYQQAYDLLLTTEEIPGALENLDNVTLELQQLLEAKLITEELYNTLMKINGMVVSADVNITTNYSGTNFKDSAQSPAEPKEWFQHGGTTVVPPGYPNDDYLIGTSSGEKIIVLTPGDQQRREISNSFLWSPNVSISNQVDADMFMDRLMERFEERLR